MSNPDFNAVVTGTVNRTSSLEDARSRYMKLFEGAHPVYYIQDQFITIAAIVNADGKLLAAGASKRNPIDKQNNMRGRAIALTRAVRIAIAHNY